MRMRLTKVDEYQFLTCLKHGVWGSTSKRFSDWQQGDFLCIIVENTLAALARVTGPPFVSREKVWDNGLFPNRIRIEFVHVLDSSQRPPMLGKVRDTLMDLWGTRYGWGILNQQIIESPRADAIANTLLERKNALDDMKDNLELLLDDARTRRVQAAKRPKHRGRPPKAGRLFAEPTIDETTPVSARDESLHTRTQGELVSLGKITGCNIWIASNDQGRTYKGKSLSADCLKRLPNLGLSDEATRRISLIDVIWISQNAPVCAFEIETSTSVYSGLLRLSDLISVVPALKMQIFIVAPKDRQDRVMRELARPTFRRIGLSDFCRFVSTSDLESLIDKVHDFGGHVNKSILDTIAVQLEDEDNEAP